jgi:hypothetical protein
VICVVTAQSFGCIRACVHPSTSLRQNAGGRDGDHFHEGVGFLAQHLKLSRRLEQSLQSLHPSLGGLPYWDTSVEMEKLRHKELERVTDAVLWSAEFFGKSGKWHHKRAEDFKVGGGRVHPASPQARLPSCLLHLYLRLLSSLPSIVSYVIPRVLRSLSLSLSLSLLFLFFLFYLRTTRRFKRRLFWAVGGGTRECLGSATGRLGARTRRTAWPSVCTCPETATAICGRPGTPTPPRTLRAGNNRVDVLRRYGGSGGTCKWVCWVFTESLLGLVGG